MSEPALTDFEDFFRVSTGVNVTQAVVEKPKDKRSLVLKVIAIVIGLFLLAQGILYAFVFPVMTTPKMVFSGNTLVSSDELEEILFPLHKKSWAGFDTRVAVSLLTSLSSVESASVEKRFPDMILINVNEREPVAKTIVTVNNASKSVQIDENGVLFNIRPAADVQDGSVPLISGLPLETLQEGMRIPANYLGLMEQIAVIRKLPSRYFAAISEIQVVSKDYGNFELVIYPVNAKVRVLTDRSLNEDALKYMMVVLDVVNSIEPDVTEIDLRYGAVSYRRRQVN